MNKYDKIEKKNIQDILALTPMQEGLLYHYLHAPKDRLYYNQLNLVLTGHIDLKYFEEAWNFVFETNEMLRTVFRWEKLENPTQVVFKKYSPDIRFIDLTVIGNYLERQKQSNKIKNEERNRKFDLRKVPFRVILCKVSDRDYHLVISNHHILYDGWSNGIILKEFFQNYEMLVKGNALRRKDFKLPFREFVGWLKACEKTRNKEFWQDYLREFDSHTQFPYKKKGGICKKKISTVKEFCFTLEKGIKERFDIFLREKRVTAAAFFYLAWGILLQKYCNRDDVIFGTTVSGRSAPINGIENMVGLFINTLPLRVSANPGETVLDLLFKINEALIQREKFENTSLVKIKEYCGLESNQELFDTLLVIENYPVENILRREDEDLSLSILSYSAVESTNYDFNMVITSHSGIGIRFIYNKEAMGEDVIFPLFRHFNRILMEIINEPDIPFFVIDMLSQGEKLQLLVDFNTIEPAFPVDKTLHGLFLEQVNRTPDHIALTGVKEESKSEKGKKETLLRKKTGQIDIGGDIISITYSQLDNITTKISSNLLRSRVNSGDLVGILMERSLEMIGSILGILKTGCAYVPMNPQAPATRNQMVLADCNVKLLLSNCSFQVISKGIEVIEFNDLSIDLKTGHGSICHNVSLYRSNENSTLLAYVIYTSGSTGKPRGVPISHSNFSPLVHWGYQQLGLSPFDRSVQNLSYFFDWSVWEIFITLTSGGVLYTVPRDVIVDSECYLDFIQRYAITVLHITPTHFLSLLHISPGKRLESLKYLCLGAEKLSCDLAERSFQWVHKDCRVFNMYGPTESTIMAAVLEIEESNLHFYPNLSSIPIGDSLGNTVLLVLDKHFNPCPIYIPGELFIGGDGVSIGYLNNPELTAEKFMIPSELQQLSQIVFNQIKGFFENIPFSRPGYQRQNIYRTGDLARWLPGGVVEFLGRIDQQVKIRGFRIEPGEIENQLLLHREIKEALVISREYEAGDRYLCAYIVPSPTHSSHLPVILKEFLTSRLPPYMVPAYFVSIDRMPLNPNGKVDIKALPVPAMESGSGYIAPRDEIERSLARIWSGILAIEFKQIGIDDNFFQLGGHSLKINALIGRIYKEMKIEIPFSVAFNKPTIREMAKYIAVMEISRYRTIPLVEEKEYYSLSSAQKRLYVLQQIDMESMVYHLQGFMVLEGELDREKMKMVFQWLVDRHESLRTSFAVINGEPVQRIHDKIKFETEHHHVGVNGAVPVPGSFIRPFDLSRSPLLRVGLADIGERSTGIVKKNRSCRVLLMVDMHHIISDGMSIEILIKEFIELYTGKKLPPLKLRYKDYTQWHHRQRLERTINSQTIYWLNEFVGELPVLNLPMDFSRPVVQVFAGAQSGFWIDEEKTASIQTIAIKENTTLFGILLSIYAVFLSRLSGQEDIIIGTPVMGRNNDAFSGVIGMFINMLAIRNFSFGNQTFRAFLRKTGKRLVGALENQEFQFDDLVERLNLVRDISRNPLFDVAFALQNPEMPKMDIPGLKAIPYEYDPGIAKFDLTLIAEKVGTRLRFTMQYCAKLFKAETIERFAQYFKQLAASIVDNPGQKISELNMLSPQERQQLILGFNNNGVHYPNDKTIHGLFMEQVKKTPDHIALAGQILNFKTQIPIRECSNRENNTHGQSGSFGMVYLTYIELDNRTDRLVDALIERGSRFNSIIAIKVERTLEMIIGILGILKTGSAYLPLDPGSPNERIDYMLKDSGAKILLTGNELFKLVDTLSSHSVPLSDKSLFFDQVFLQQPEQGTISLGEKFSEPEDGPRGHIGLRTPFASGSSVAKNFLPATDHSPPATSLAYIIYTSGSTGKPKGIPITHGNFSPLIHWGYRQLGIGTKDRTLQNLSYFFDWSVWEIFITLTTGASMYMVAKDIIMKPAKCIEFIRQHALSVLHITPTHYTYLVNTGKPMETLCYLFIGAEKLTYDLVKRSINAVNPTCRIFNMYGPTEATIISAVLEIDRSRVEEYKELSSVPIGSPSGNFFLLVLDKYFNLSPVKVTGELVIGGDGIAMGYLNNPELTIEKFLTTDGYGRNGTISYKMFCGGPGDGFSKEPPGRRRLYKTGDLARWLPDGSVEFLGRKDHQVKIRGYRLELGEIENHLLDYPGIKDAVLVVKENPSREKYLCAYIVSGEDFDLTQLKKTLAGFLPDYMIPSYFVRMEKLPLNPNKKIDLKALPEPETIALQDYEAPSNEIERKLADIWSDVLGIEKDLIGVESDFFNLGGHSLKAAKLTAEIEKKFQVKTPLTELFVTATIRGLAAFISQAKEFRFQSIEPVEKKEYYPLSSAQKRLYFLQKIDENGFAYNIPSIWHLEGELDLEKFESVFRQLVRRHESLRTSFILVNEEPVQQIYQNIEFEIEYHHIDADGVVPAPGSFIRPFDLSRAPLLRANLIKVEGGGTAKECSHGYSVFMFDIHHIISDGISVEILIREFMELYTKKRLPPLKLQYKDYTQWHHRQALENTIKPQEIYWLNEFVGEVPVLNLTTDFSRPVAQVFSGAQSGFWIDEEKTTTIQTIVKKEKITLFAILFSIYAIFLSRLSGQEDIIIGTPVAGRKNNDLMGVIGMFVNMVAVRNLSSGSQTFLEFLRESGKRLVEALENQEFQFEDLVERLNLNRDTSRNPLFDVVFAMQNYEMPQMDIPGLKATPYEYDPGIAKFDITLIAEQVDTRFRFTMQYCTRLFKAETIERFAGHFKQLVASIVENPEQRISELNLLTPQEKQQLIFEFNDTGDHYPNDKTIHGLFGEQVKKTPDGVALTGQVANFEFPNSQQESIQKEDKPYKSLETIGMVYLTYSELDNKTDRVADILIEKGCRINSIVAIKVERTVEMIIGILGILKTGSAYLPIDPDSPNERIDYMLMDSGAEICLTGNELYKFFNSPSFLSVSSVSSVAKKSLPATGHRPSVATLAYIIYTSGSTGKPKGVPITHSNFSPLIHWGHQQLGIGTNDRSLQNLSYFFDWSVWEIFITLTTGASLYMVSRDIIMNPDLCIDFIHKHSLTVLHITPTHYTYLVSTGKSIETLCYLFIGAEKLTYGLVKRSIRAVNPTCRIFNMYGPTEATIISAVLEIKRCRADEYKELSSVPIGRPSGNFFLLVLDRYFNLCPVTVAGELVIGSDGIAMGYLNNPELTAVKFLTINGYERDGTISYKKFCGGPGGGFSKEPPGRRRFYKTGDLARWLPDGLIEFLGRKDHQVKIRGYRLELGEIENHLLDYPGIKDAVLVVRENPSREKYLCAYIVSGEDFDLTQLKKTLAGFLPDYMIPSSFVRLDKLPLNSNKKIDLKALPEPEANTLQDYEPPKNEIERKLTDIWSGILGIEKDLIGVESDFFKLRGQSLKAAILTAEIEKKFQVKVPLTEIFITPTIRGLAVFISQAEKFRYQSIEPVEKKEYYPLSSAQKRLYFLQKMDESGFAYNIPSIWRVEGELDLEKFRWAFKQLILRHECLRTSFHLVDEEPVQRIHEEVEFEIDHHVTEDGAVPAPGSFIRPFDLSRPPLLRASLIKVNAKGNTKENTCRYIVLMFDMHHIISDGISAQIIIREFSTLYKGKELPEIKLRYTDYVEWQNRQRENKKFSGQGGYWQREFEGEIPALDLPTDFERPVKLTFEGSSLGFEIDKKTTGSLKSLALETGTTLYIVLLAIYTILLSKLSGREDIVVGTPVAGRKHADLEGIIGMFVNTLALRNYPAEGKRFLGYITEVKERTLKAFENQEYPYEDLIERLNMTKDASRNPLFDTMFALQNTGSQQIDIPGLKFISKDYEINTSIFDLTLTVVEVEEKLELNVEYNTRLFKPETVKSFIDFLKQIITIILNNREKKLAEIKIKHQYKEIESSTFSSDLGDLESIFSGE